MKRKLLFFFVIGLIISCKPNKSVQNKIDFTSEPLYQKAQDLAFANIIADGHVDLPYRLRIQNFRLEREYLGIPIDNVDNDFDYVRAKEGGLDAPFMSIFIPSDKQEKGEAKKLADTLINMVTGIADAHSDKFKIAFGPEDIQAAFDDGRLALPMGMENGAPIEDDLANIEYFRKRGIGYITLTHSKDNQICDSSYDTTRTWNGLSPFGEEVVKEINRAGIMIDISHVSDETFYQVMEITKAPVIASHSSCRKFIPDFERNMSDDMIKKMKENDGVIHINFGSTFIDEEIRNAFNERRNKLNELLAAQSLSRDDPAAEEIIEEFGRENPILFSDVYKVADHIDHVVNLAGIDHVGFGSDFDGVGDSLPIGLKDVSTYPNLIYVLLQRGYSEDEISKICYKNLFRVWNKVHQISEDIKKAEANSI